MMRETAETGVFVVLLFAASIKETAAGLLMSDDTIILMTTEIMYTH